MISTHTIFKCGNCNKQFVCDHTKGEKVTILDKGKDASHKIYCFICSDSCRDSISKIHNVENEK